MKQTGTTHRTVSLWCKLTEPELLSYGQDIAEDERRMTALEVERKETMCEIKGRRDEVAKRIALRADAISMKRELRPVEIAIDSDGVVVRMDTGERVGLHEISAEDRQGLIDYGATGDED